jgi:ubiquinol-cytochrome c reductase cytochrome c subunit
VHAIVIRLAVKLPALAIAVIATLTCAAVAEAEPRSGVVHVQNEDELSLQELGSQLYAGNCSVCHGIDGRGVPRPRKGTGGIMGQGPSLRNVGALTADFYLRTGYMPLGDPNEQPSRSRVEFSDREIRALTSYVASLGTGPPVPDPQPQSGNLAEGLELFTEHCAGCHQVVARGGVVTGARVPPLEDANATQIAQAVRIGPYLMPKFSERDISDRELDSIVAYVLDTKHPDDRGGWGIGNVGPIPEGMVTWFLAATAFLGLVMVIGRRAGS